MSTCVVRRNVSSPFLIVRIFKANPSGFDDVRFRAGAADKPPHIILECVTLTAGLALALLNDEIYAGCFLVGLLLGQARAASVYAALPRILSYFLAPVGIVVALILVGRRQTTGDQGLLTLGSLAALLLFSLYACPPVVGWLTRSRFSQFLGRISYLLYLWHFIVLITLTSQLIVATADVDGAISTLVALAIGILTVLVSVVVSRWTLWIEGWSRSVNAVLLRWLWKEQAITESGRSRL